MTHPAVVMPDVSPFKNEREARERIKRLEREVHRLKSSNQNYRGIIENMELGILEVDLNERIVKAYPQFCALVGYSEAELLGENAKQMLLDSALHENMDAQTKKRNEGQSGLYEMPIRTKGGEVKWLLISGVPIRDDGGEVVGSMGTHYDITERKEEEEALRAAKEAAELAQQSERAFLARMSHEIRTPLNAIMGMSNLMSDTGLNEEQLHFMGAIQDGSALLHRMLSGLLDLSKLDANKMEVKRAPTVPEAIMTGVVRSFEPILSAKDVEVQCHWTEDMSSAYLLDGTILTQVLLNLVGNAVKFTQKGRIDVRASWMSNGPTKGQLCVEVNDTGIGIAAADLSAVFNRFKQASNREVHHGGTGLGLALVQEMCRIHGGEVSVQSEVGVGSSFRFTLEAAQVTAQAVAPKSAEVTLSGLRVLVAEDNETNALIVETLLKRWGCQAVMTGDGLAAFEAFRAQAFDLVLMDLEMPICDGKAATRLIRDFEQAESRTTMPIMALSAFAFEEDKLQALAAGMSGFLSKPYTEAELKAAITQQMS